MHSSNHPEILCIICAKTTKYIGFAWNVQRKNSFVSREPRVLFRANAVCATNGFQTFCLLKKGLTYEKRGRLRYNTWSLILLLYVIYNYLSKYISKDKLTDWNRKPKALGLETWHFSQRFLYNIGKHQENIFGKLYF